MNAFEPSATSRVASTLSGVLILSVIAIALLHVNTGFAVSARPLDRVPGSTSLGLRVPAAPFVARPAERPAVTSARDLPIHVSVESGAMLEAWARTDGPALLAQAEALGPWNEVEFGRFLAIRPLVFDAADRVGIGPLFLFQALASESALDPLAQGPEPGDRGLGQVSFASERTASAWAADAHSPYHVAGFQASTSIWEPRQNVTLAAIVMRSIYAMPDVTSNDEAYARYTSGVSAVHGSTIADRAVPRVRRANGYEPSLRVFLALSAVDPRRDADTPALKTGLVADMLRVTDGKTSALARYRALRELYLSPRAARTYVGAPWSLVLHMQDALTFARLAERVDGENVGADVARIDALVRDQLPHIEAGGNAALVDAAHRLLDEADAAGQPQRPPSVDTQQSSIRR